jgi:hypothetical protein
MVRRPDSKAGGFRQRANFHAGPAVWDQGCLETSIWQAAAVAVSVCCLDLAACTDPDLSKNGMLAKVM